MASIAEKEMRDSVTDKLRRLRPMSRIIHELNTAGTGSPRADIACIGPNELILFEIKSEKDVLKRVPHQYEAFNRCSHNTFLVLDNKKFFRNNATPDELKGLKSFKRRDNVWHYPETPGRLWTIEPSYITPDTRAFLTLLWRAELIETLNNLNLPYHAKDNMPKLIERIILGATGRQIVEMVCYCLRKRIFANGDLPV